jgi:hypothetical protein
LISRPFASPQSVIVIYPLSFPIFSKPGPFIKNR